MDALTAIEDCIASAAGAAGPAVVGIGRRGPLGSGVVVGTGRVLTNAHNLRTDRVTVTFGDGRVEQAGPAGVDPDGDLAVLAVDTGDVAPVEWTAGEAPRLGAAVVGLANPGGRGLRATLGFVSGLDRTFRGPRGRRIRGNLEHTAPLLPGSSGGPLVDRHGRMVGINTNRLGEGFYLAIPADGALRSRVEELAGGEAAPRPRLGVGVVPARVGRGMRRAVGLPEVDGVLIRMVEPGGPADAAGIRVGDLITSVDGRPVLDLDDLYDSLDATLGQVEIGLVRGAAEQAVSVDLGGERARE